MKVRVVSRAVRFAATIKHPVELVEVGSCKMCRALIPKSAHRQLCHRHEGTLVELVRASLLSGKIF